ncbi:MAG: tRNA (guanosine(46)-N7)-methyltransferase TrmB [Bacteroidota bacterium]
MGSKNKLKRFEENETFSNLIQPERETLVKDSFRFKGNWNRDFFKNTHPIVVELGCGKGEYTVNLAGVYPDKNFIGIDIKGARIWRGAKTALTQKLSNVAFLRTQIELITAVFDKHEVSELWITFPDPQLKYRRSKHRLINPEFLRKYRKILKRGSSIHLKTDSEFLFGYTLGLLQGEGHEIIYAHHNIYHNEDAPEEATGIQTFYEQHYLERGKPITYIKFKLS